MALTSLASEIHVIRKSQAQSHRRLDDLFQSILHRACRSARCRKIGVQTEPARQANSFSARSVIADWIFRLKSMAAKGRLPEISTCDAFTVSVPDT